MADNESTKQTNESSPVDETKNLKAEFNRKMSNLEEVFKKSQQELLSRMEAMVKPVAPTKPVENDNLAELMYSNPALYAEKIQERAAASIEKRLDERNAKQAQTNQTMQQLYKEFPELNQDDHELTQSALKKYSELVKSSGDTPSSYKAAVYEAALEAGLKPKSKRAQSEDDNFSIEGSGTRRETRPNAKSDKFDPGIAEAARAFGVDPERVKARMAKRRNITRWE